MVTLERWKTFSKRDQIGHIASEIQRAILARDKNDNTLFSQILERAIDLITLSLDDQKWKDNPLPLLVLRDELAKVYIGGKSKADLEKIYMAL